VEHAVSLDGYFLDITIESFGLEKLSTSSEISRFRMFIHLLEAVELLADHVVDEPTDAFIPEEHSPSVYDSSNSEVANLHCESENTAILTVVFVAVVIAYLLSSVAVQVFSA
jgi:hypothetical protein